MTSPVHARRRCSVFVCCVVGALGAGLLVSGCGKSEATATERLWVSGVPTHPKAQVTAFLTTRTRDSKYIGAFFRGSLLQGRHDVFEWVANGDKRATLRFLQSGDKAQLRLEDCKPGPGFDYCLLVHGDPTGVKKYQSRKRWAVRRPNNGKKAVVGVVTAFAELVSDDESLKLALGSEI